MTQVSTAVTSSFCSVSGLVFHEPSDLPGLWEAVWSLLAPAVAMSNGRHSEASVCRALLDRRDQLWTWWDEGELVCVVVTELNRYPGGVTCCDLMWCGGRNMELWAKPMLAIVERWAMENGCTLMCIVGRPGWERALPGFRRSAVVLEKGLG